MTAYYSPEELTRNERVVIRPRRERVEVASTSEEDLTTTTSSLRTVPRTTSVVRREAPAADPILLSMLKDMTVVSVANGARVGTIKDVFFDTGSQRVAAFILASDDGDALLPFTAIHTIGADAVTVENDSTIPDLRSLSNLTQLKAVSSDGTLLGVVKELEVDRHSGRLTELLVHQGGVLGLGGTQQSVPALSVRSIGAQLAMVDAHPGAE